MNLDKVVNGILKYMNAEIFPQMSGGWQEFLARLAVSRMLNSVDLHKTLSENAYVKTFAIMDSEGNVDVEGLVRDLRDQIALQGKLTINLPLFGSFSFTTEDVEKLHRHIIDG